MYGLHVMSVSSLTLLVDFANQRNRRPYEMKWKSNVETVARTILFLVLRDFSRVGFARAEKQDCRLDPQHPHRPWMYLFFERKPIHPT